MIKLSKRLQAVAGCVPPGLPAADIGTDHAFLPIYLAENGICPRVLAMDVREGPLSRAAEHVKRYRLEDRIELRLSDGLNALLPGEAEVIILAGMGGKLITRILENDLSLALGVRKLVISPQSEIPETRYWLEDHGFRISREQFLLDEGKYYRVLEAVPGRDPYGREIYYLFGRTPVREKSPVLLKYLGEQAAFYQEMKENLEKQDSRKAKARQEEVTRLLRLIEEAQDEMQ